MQVKRTGRRMGQWGVPLHPVHLVLAACLLLLSGCVYVPLPDKVVSGPDFRDALGDDVAEKTPIRPGIAFREQIVWWLGEPQVMTPDNRAVQYRMDVRPGVWVAPLGIRARHRRVTLTLHYYPDNMLQAYDLHADQYSDSFLFSIHNPGMWPSSPITPPSRPHINDFLNSPLTRWPASRHKGRHRPTSAPVAE